MRGGSGESEMLVDSGPDGGRTLVRRLLQKAEEGTGSLSLQSLLTVPAEVALSACNHSPQLS